MCHMANDLTLKCHIWGSEAAPGKGALAAKPVCLLTGTHMLGRTDSHNLSPDLPKHTRMCTHAHIIHTPHAHVCAHTNTIHACT